MKCMRALLTHGSAAGQVDKVRHNNAATEACRWLHGYLRESIWSAYALILLINQRTTAPFQVRSRWFKLLVFHTLRQGQLARDAHVDVAIRSKLDGYATARAAEFGEMARRGAFGTLEL